MTCSHSIGTFSLVWSFLWSINCWFTNNIFAFYSYLVIHFICLWLLQLFSVYLNSSFSILSVTEISISLSSSSIKLLLLLGISCILLKCVRQGLMCFIYHTNNRIHTRLFCFCITGELKLVFYCKALEWTVSNYTHTHTV